MKVIKTNRVYLHFLLKQHHYSRYNKRKYLKISERGSKIGHSHNFEPNVKYKLNKYLKSMKFYYLHKSRIITVLPQI